MGKEKAYVVFYCSKNNFGRLCVYGDFHNMDRVEETEKLIEKKQGLSGVVLIGWKELTKQPPLGVYIRQQNQKNEQ